MPTVAVVLSDLHLGSDRSAAGPAALRESGVTYSEHLRRILFDPIRAVAGARVPFLVLNGDTLDFSLQDYQKVFYHASQFFDVLLKEQLFDNVVYISGNHDHNVWQLVQSEVSVVRPVAGGEAPKAYPYIQPGVVDLGAKTLSLSNVSEPLGDVFLKGLFGSKGTENKAPPIAVVYPNLFLAFKGDADAQVAPILVTHGHFFCVPWILMTEVFPKTLEVDRSVSLRDLEQLNAPLTELVWTALGQAGALTKAAARIYDEGVERRATWAASVLDELAEYLDSVVFKYGWYDPREWGSDAIIGIIKNVLQNLILQGVASSAKHKGDEVFLDDPENVERIGRYLDLSFSQYVSATGDRNATLPSAILFGHTHVPIRPEQNASVEVLRNDMKHRVRAYNTGGWMADAKGVGACAAFVNERAEVTFSELWRP
jgi:hypothetical protein